MSLLQGVLGGIVGGLQNAVQAVPKAVVHTVNGVTSGAQSGAAGTPIAAVPGLPDLTALPAKIQQAASQPHPSGNGTVLDHMVMPVLAMVAGLAATKLPLGPLRGPVSAAVVSLGLKGLHDALHALEQPYSPPAGMPRPAGT
jgi:hypothetical protein